MNRPFLTPASNPNLGAPINTKTLTNNSFKRETNAKFLARGLSNIRQRADTTAKQPQGNDVANISQAGGSGIVPLRSHGKKVVSSDVKPNSNHYDSYHFHLNKIDLERMHQ